METTITAPENVKTTVASISVQEFMQQKGFVQIHNAVRCNVNGYPYITFINEANESENIYFSVNAAAMVAEGELVGPGFFKPYTMVLAKNAAGEPRWKISSGKSTRVSIADLF